MKKIILLLAAFMGLAAPSFAQNDKEACEVVCKKGKTKMVRCDEGYFMNIYDKGEKEYLTCFLGETTQEARQSVCRIQDWYAASNHRDYKENCHPHHGHHGEQAGTCPVTFYHGAAHCYVSEGNGEFCRRHVSRKEKGKEYLLARIDKKFLEKAMETLNEQ